jgi:hypothetical protein
MTDHNDDVLDEAQLAWEASADGRHIQLAVRLGLLPSAQHEIQKLIASGALPISPGTLGREWTMRLWASAMDRALTIFY